MTKMFTVKVMAVFCLLHLPDGLNIHTGSLLVMANILVKFNDCRLQREKTH